MVEVLGQGLQGGKFEGVELRILVHGNLQILLWVWGVRAVGFLLFLRKSYTGSKTCMKPTPEASQPGNVPKPGAWIQEALQNKVGSYVSKRRGVTLNPIW